MLEQSWWLWGAVLPLVVSAAVMMIGLRFRPLPLRIDIASPLAVALGYAVGSAVYLAIKRSLAWPPTEATDWLAMVVLPVALLVEVMGAYADRQYVAIRWIGRAVMIIGTPPLMLLPFLKNNWSAGESLIWCGGLAAAIAVVWVLMDCVVGVKQRPSPQPSPSEGRGGEPLDHRETFAPWLALTITAAGVGATILASGSVVLGQFALTLAATLFGAWLACVFSRGAAARISGASGGEIGVAVVLLTGLLINGFFYAEMKPWAAVVLAVAPLMAWVSRVPRIQKLKGWQVGLIVALLTGAVVAAVVVPTMRAAMLEMQESGYE